MSTIYAKTPVFLQRLISFCFEGFVLIQISYSARQYLENRTGGTIQYTVNICKSL